MQVMTKRAASLATVLVIVAATLIGTTTAARASWTPRPNCGDGASSSCLRAQIAWELAYALSKTNADGTSPRVVNGTRESDWRSPSYPSSDANALNALKRRFGGNTSLWGNYWSPYHGGQCFFFAHDITYRASRGYLLLPTTTSGLYGGATSNRRFWKVGDVLQFSSGSSHTAVIYKINARDANGLATSVDVIDSNWNVGSGSELIHRHTIRVTSGSSMSNLAYSWKAYGYGKY